MFSWWLIGCLNNLFLVQFFKFPINVFVPATKIRVSGRLLDKDSKFNRVHIITSPPIYRGILHVLHERLVNHFFNQISVTILKRPKYFSENWSKPNYDLGEGGWAVKKIFNVIIVKWEINPDVYLKPKHAFEKWKICW